VEATSLAQNLGADYDSYSIADTMKIAIFPGIGTLINIVAIIAGSALGVLVGGRMSIRTRNLLTDTLGLTVILAGAGALISLWSPRCVSSLPTGWTLLSLLAILLIGGLIGSAARLEDRLDGLGEKLRIRFRASSEGHFVEGFVSASLIFAIGSNSRKHKRRYVHGNRSACSKKYS
jgi:uncharacterized membrane protein YqgA involved in biofilm formation